MSEGKTRAEGQTSLVKNEISQITKWKGQQSNLNLGLKVNQN